MHIRHLEGTRQFSTRASSKDSDCQCVNPFPPEFPPDPSREQVREGFYCPLANINLDAANVPFDGTLRSIKNHQCFTKCSLNAPCISGVGTPEFPASDESDCFCNGMSRRALALATFRCFQ